MRARLICLAIGVSIFVFAFPRQGVGARLISLRFAGHVGLIDDIDNLLGGAISVGDPVAGTFTYDLATEDSEPQPCLGLYLHLASPNGIVAEINELPFRTHERDVDFEVYVDDCLFHPADVLTLTSWNNIVPIIDPEVVESSVLSIAFSDLNHEALASDALPTELDLNDWTFAFGSVHIDAGENGTVFIQYSIEELETCASHEGCGSPTCSDGIDNDCDGLVDSEDPDCMQWCVHAVKGATITGHAHVLTSLMLLVLFVILWRYARQRTSLLK